jgi:hypothetical protein
VDAIFSGEHLYNYSHGFTTLKMVQKYDYNLFILQDCIGVIDGTHITAKVSRAGAASYRGVKNYTSQNLLIVVDFDMKFTYVLAGWEGSAHDSNILAGIMSRPDGINIPPGIILPW